MRTEPVMTLWEAGAGQPLDDPSLLRTDGLIGGRWTAGKVRHDISNPATGEPLAKVANLDEGDVEAAISAAASAFPRWRATSARQRSRLLMEWYHLIRRHEDDLARILTAEQGKPLGESLSEVRYGASYVEWFAEEARRLNGEIVPVEDTATRALVLRQPVGVCAAITPWNFPLAMVTRKVAPALAAGCPVVLKPSEQTPLTALALAELTVRAGIPDGVINVVPAARDRAAEIGAALCASPVIRHLSFTGSTDIGRLLMRQSATTVKRLSLELGGNAPFLVFDDADLDSAVEGAIASKFRNAGQTCVCANRFLVQDGIHDAFVSRLTERAASLRCGNGIERDVQIGPLIDERALRRMETVVTDALSHGAMLETGGQRIGQRHFAPTVLSKASHAMRCAQEEIFGPIAPVFRFRTEEDAILAANASEAGLAAYVFTRDMGRLIRVSEALECGMVGANTGRISNAELPFGGVKQSGLGREGSRHGLDDYVELKSITLGGLE